jgi:glycosyltransferase involved in cell wall biosynthesis
MRVSVVVRSKDEADRLRLTLASLARQTLAAEVVVVDDGSRDHTPAVLAQAARDLPLKVITHERPRGRSGASNAGAHAATGDLVVFLDGDTLAAPEMVGAHAAAHAGGVPRIGRGGRYHLRCTRFLLDPETATPRPGEEGRLARLAPAERARLTVTRAQVLDDFAANERRAERGVYPGAGPRRLDELEMDALHQHPELAVNWVAVCGANVSVPRDLFLAAGGFDEALDINEHRELALRLCLAGARMVPVDTARAYHLTHRRGWHNPLDDTAWEVAFYARHPQLVVKLLSVFWASLAPDSRIPPTARIMSLPELEAAARGDNGIDYDVVRRLIGSLPELPSMRRAAVRAGDATDGCVGAEAP